MGVAGCTALPPCPAPAPGLLHTLQVDTAVSGLAEVERRLARLKLSPGGSFAPPHCQPDQVVIIFCPYFRYAQPNDQATRKCFEWRTVLSCDCADGGGGGAGAGPGGAPRHLAVPHPARPGEAADQLQGVCPAGGSHCPAARTIALQEADTSGPFNKAQLLNAGVLEASKAALDYCDTCLRKIWL